MMRGIYAAHGQDSDVSFTLVSDRHTVILKVHCATAMNCDVHQKVKSL